jgi:hypothetical protein
MSSDFVLLLLFGPVYAWVVSYATGSAWHLTKRISMQRAMRIVRDLGGDESGIG